MPRNGILAGERSSGHERPEPSVADASTARREPLDVLRSLAGFRPGPELKIARRLLEGGLLVALAWTAGRTVWLVADPAGSVAPVRTASLQSEPNGASALPPADLAILERAALFGEQFDNASLADVPETQLNLRLAGLRSAEDGSGMAIISVSGAPAKLFRPGDALVDGVQLESIHAAYVVLRKRDGLETLSFRGEPGHSQSAASEAAMPATNGARLVSAADLSALTLEPFLQGGALTGYRVAAANDSGVLARLGLDQGDVLLTAGGQSLAQINPAELRTRLTSGASVQVGLQRGGRNLVQTFQTQEIPTQ
ncbi:MAG: hypothetical protein IPK75_10925 [Acidobacteria bacterium]|jgi:general secretion pathway protein C|nr:hypothetical protein [Acidobacteriota bacterium]